MSSPPRPTTPTTFDQEAKNVSWTHTGEDMNVLMLEDFLWGIEGGFPAGASGVDGLRTLEIVLAAYRSARSYEPREVDRTQAWDLCTDAGSKKGETRGWFERIKGAWRV